jgi:hypothetical protein
MYYFTSSMPVWIRIIRMMNERHLVLYQPTNSY